MLSILERTDYTPWMQGYSIEHNGRNSPWRKDDPPRFFMWMKEERFKRYGNNLPEDDFTVDFGCGNGVKTIYLARDLGMNPVIGIDLNPIAITEARRNAQDSLVKNQVYFYQGNVLELTRQFEDRSIRNITDIYRLTHDGVTDSWGYDEKRQTIKEYRRIIKPDGLLGLEFFAIDPHFYGFTLDRGKTFFSKETGRLLRVEYSFIRDPSDQEMAKSPESYNGMFNSHLTQSGVKELLDGLFEVIRIEEPRHTRPDQRHRHTVSVLAIPV